jgi:nucleoside-diphosphate-sugar epimerase
MRVFVLGGTGAIGRPTVDALLAGGHEVSALARSTERAEGLRAKGVAPVDVSIFDAGALAAAFAGHDAVVNLSSNMPSSLQFVRMKAWEPTVRVRTEGSAAVVDAALAAAVPVLIQESVVMLLADGGDTWLDETSPVDHFPTTKGNHAAEASAARFTAAGGAGIIARLGFFYGPGAAHAEQFLALARFGVAPVLGRAESYLSSIHVEDGGRAIEALLHAPAGTYSVVDDAPVTKLSYANAIAAAAGHRPLLKPPGRAALLLGHRTTSLTRSLRVTNRKLREATGWAPRYPSAREGWTAMAAGTRGGQ